MCDYSLESYRSRPAREGEQYVTHRFPTGTLGFCAPGDPTTAVCMAYDTQLKLEAIPKEIQTALGVKAEESVTFVCSENGLFHDSIRFADGEQVTLQRLGPGIKASIEKSLIASRLEPRRFEAVS